MARSLRFRRRAGIAILATSLLIQLTYSTIGAPFALATCTGRSAHDTAARYAITSAAISQLTGVSASVTQYDPYYSGYNGTGTNATVMLANSTATSWAQLGWFKSKLDGGVVKREDGLQYWVSPSNNYFKWFTSQPVGNSVWYEVLYEAPTTWNFFIGGTYVWGASGSFTSDQYQIFGETHDYVDQMPGGTASHVVFLNSNYFTGSGHTAHYVASIIHTDPQFGVSHPSTARYEIWDGAC